MIRLFLLFCLSGEGQALMQNSVASKHAANVILPVAEKGNDSLGAAIQKTIGRGQAHDQQGALCISLAAYEDPQWVHFLIANVLRFTDCSTKIALHLNNYTDYSKEDVDKFNQFSTRVSVNPERINVDFNRLSILHAHVLNALHMQRVWGGQCSYYAIQASNQLWIKPGVEPYVAEFRISGIKQRAYNGCEGFCKQQHWAVANRAWSIPEGTFVPMSLMNSFTKDYMGWYHAECKPGTDCLNDIGGKEEDWLQTYACVHDGPLQLSASQIGQQLTVADVEEIIKAGSECALDRSGQPTSYYEKHQEFCKRTNADSMAPFSVKVNHWHGPDRPESDTHNPDGPLAKWLDLAKEPFFDEVSSYIMNLTYATSPDLIEHNSC